MENPLLTIILTALDLWMEEQYKHRDSLIEEESRNAEDVLFASERIREDLHHLNYLINKRRF
jgi:hypothetical protein